MTEVVNAPAAAPVVSAASGVGLGGPMHSEIDELTGGVPLGSTEVGKAWCLKALHPADTNVLASPMPVNETKSFASVQFQQMKVIPMPGTFATNKTWNLELVVMRDPILLYAIRLTQSGAADVLGYEYSI